MKLYVIKKYMYFSIHVFVLDGSKTFCNGEKLQQGKFACHFNLVNFVFHFNFNKMFQVFFFY